MNEITVKTISIDDLTAEQFKIIERRAILKDLEQQYEARKREITFDVQTEITDWLETVASVHTRRMYLTAINHFLRYCNYKVLTVRAKDADKYILFLKEDKCAGGTVKLYTHAVSSFYTYLERGEHISRNPFHSSRVKIDSKPKDKYVPTSDEVNSLLLYYLNSLSLEMGVKMRMATELMANYGVRVGFFNDVSVNGDVLISTSKGKEYKVFLEKEADIAYYTYGKDILESMNSNTISKMFNDAVNFLYLNGQIKQKFSPHCLRHYFATNYYREHGGDKLVELMGLLGHSSITTTMIYLRSLNLIQ